MNYPRTILIGAVLIAGAIALSLKAEAVQNSVGKFQIVSAPQKIGNVQFPGVWRIDTVTGQVNHCLAYWVVGKTEKKRISCLQ